MKQVRILKVVLASPKDVQAERDALSSIIDELNKGVAASKDLRLELLRWETDSYPGFHVDGPQGLIDEVLNIKESDLLIGIFWKRFGTPTKNFGSGTESEFFDAYDSWRGKGSPQIMFYFNQKPFMPSSSEEAEQVKRVLDFKKQFPGEGLFWTYKGKAQFEKKVREHLTKWVLDYKPKEPPKEEINKTTPKTDDDLKKIYADELGKFVGKVRFLGEEKSRNLEDVFVELTIVEEYERPFRDVEFLSFMDSDRRRRYTLFGDEDREDPNKEGRVKEKRIVKPDELLRPNRKAIVTGAPGCGKTTLLKYLANRILNEGKRLPVFLELKTITKDDLKNADGELGELLFNKAIVKNLHLGAEQSEQLKRIFLEELKSNNAAVFLDGFDEVRDGNLFAELCQSIESFLRSDYGQNSLVVSTRPYAMNRISLDLEQMEIAPLNQKQIEAFLNAYYKTDGACKKILSELRKQNPLSDMVRVPILLSSIVELYREKEAIAADASRTDIYQKITKRLIAKLDQEKSVQRFAFRIADTEGTLKLDFLKHLAFERLITDEPEEAGERREVSRLIFTDEVILEKAKEYVRRENLPDINPMYLADDVKGTALLREIGDDSYAFAHLTIHEYLAATLLAKHEDREKLFSRTYFNPSLVEMEVLPMTLGLTNNAEPLYQSLEQLSESLNFINLRLRARGLGYGAKVSEETLTRLSDFLLRLITDNKNDGEPFLEIVSYSFSNADSKHLGSIVSKITPLLNSEDANVRKKAIVVLKELRDAGSLEALIKVLDDPDDTVRENAIITLGRLGDPTALNRLFEVALLKGNLLPVTEAIEKNLSQQPVKDLINELNDQSSPRRKLIANVLGKIKQKEATESLIKILQSNEDSWLRRNAAEALGEIGDEVAEDGLFETLRSDWNNDVRLAAAYALGKISGGKTLEYLSDTLIRKSHERNKLTDKMLMYLNGEQAIKVLLISLTDEDSAIRNVAALRLGEIRDEAAIHPLLDALKDEDSKVRYNAAWALGKIGDKQTISSLLNVLNNQNEENDVRGSAAQALGRIGDKQAVNGLLKALQDNSHDIHSAMADALGRIGDNKAVEGLIAALKHKNCPAVWSISLALGHIGDHRAVDSLMEVFNNERGFVRETALVSLGRIGGEKATKILIEKLSDDDPGIRSTAAQALGDALEKTDSEEAVGALLNTLADEYGAPLWFAANTLIQVNIKKLSAGLARALSHENNYVRRKAAQVVGFYSIESNIFEELSRMASTDADREVRAAAADAKEKFLHKLALFDVPTDELLAAENAGREEALEDTRSFIAHEVRHALLPLDMATKMLSEELSKSKFDREAVDEYVQIILEQTKAGFDVVSQLQEYAKTLTPDKQPTDIHALLKQSVEEKRLDCEQNNIRIVKKFGRLPKIDIDQEMIKAVLRNIIDNALESMERDGVLTLATYQNKNHAAIEISDTGKGIEPEHLRRVFELGFTTKLGKKGAGIGMALSRRYIEQAHKGHIAIANNINGKGATVKIVLPITERSSDNGN